jgi:gluconate 2-dehydrogenase gamma chain
MSDITRRRALGHLATAIAAAGTFDRLAAKTLYDEVQRGAMPGPYVPKALSAQQFRTLERLADLIIPVENGKPGAVGAGVPAWIDALLNVNTELKSRYVSGLTWLDTTVAARGASDFVSATPAQQTALLDVIAFKKNQTTENASAIAFFALARRMTVDGFYTSDIGTKDINPFGRPPRTIYVVPQENIDYVISQSPFK